MSRITTALMIAGFCLAGSTLANAKSCGAAKTHVSGYGCVAKSVISQARKNCKKSNITNFKECLCSDGKLVGACGD